MSEFQTPAEVIGSKSRSGYKTPQWRALAAEVRRRAGNKCESCRQSGKPIQAHHNYYLRDRNGLDDYQPEELRALCTDCHRQFHKAHLFLRQHVLPKMPTQALECLVVKLALALERNDPIQLAHAIGYLSKRPGRTVLMAQEDDS